MKVISQELYDQLMIGNTCEIPINHDDQIKEIVKLLPHNQQSKAEKILNLLTATKKFVWRPQGQIVYSGEEIPESHIVDLISLCTKKFPTKRWNLPGLPQFLNILRVERIPDDLVSAQMHNLMQTTPKHQDYKWITFEDLYHTVQF